MSKTLLINEIFFSIQGESTYAGRPCVFVRLAVCDLRCAWCDTEYAFYDGARMEIDEILVQVNRFPASLVEVTGGEPLLQEDVHGLISRLLDAGKEVLIETGGHIDISKVDSRAVLIYDIKCPDSGMSDRNRWTNLELLRPQDEVKFVLASRRDYDWARAVLEDRGLADSRTVIFSPVWGALEPNRLADWVLSDGLPIRVQVQLHKVLWGPSTRGV